MNGGGGPHGCCPIVDQIYRFPPGSSSHGPVALFLFQISSSLSHAIFLSRRIPTLAVCCDGSHAGSLRTLFNFLISFLFGHRFAPTHFSGNHQEAEPEVCLSKVCPWHPFFDRWDSWHGVRWLPIQCKGIDTSDECRTPATLPSLFSFFFTLKFATVPSHPNGPFTHTHSRLWCLCGLCPLSCFIPPTFMDPSPGGAA